ncbi:MAG: DUF3592 domain-containing protein [Planctomycetota bacterium]
MSELPPRRRGQRALVVILPLLAAAVWTAPRVREHWLQRRALERFQPAQATILDVREEQVRAARGSAQPLRTRRTLLYEYAVAGERYLGERYAYVEAQPAAGAFRRGQRCEVYYDPEDPREAVVLRTRPLVAPVLVSLLAPLAALALALYLAHAASRPREEA